ncbi:MAG: hypothetical protein JST63_03555 [Bacteroidetes bacterium]|nr:hypothetical protein [Bacteroidota bacterium]
MKKITALKCFFLVCCVAHTGLCQTNRADSLLKKMYTAHTDREKLEAALAVCEDYRVVSRDTLDYYAFYARSLAEKINNKKLKDLAELAVAADYLRWGWMDSVQVTVTPVLEQNSKENTNERPVYFKALRLKAMSYAMQSRFQEGLAVLYKIINEAEAYKDTLTLSENINTIGSVELGLNKPREALTWLSRAHSLTTDAPAYKDIKAAVFVNMAEAYLQMKKNDSANIYINKGISLFTETENLFNLAIALQKQSAIFIASGHIDKAENSLKELIALRKKGGDSAVFVGDNVNLVNFYIQTKQVDKAIDYCKALLVIGDLHSSSTGSSLNLANHINIRLDYYELLAKCYKIKGDNKQYMQTLEQIIAAKDSFYQYNSAQAIAELQTKYEVQRKENTIIQQQLSIIRKNNRFYTLLGVALFILLTLAVWFYGYRKKEKFIAAQSVARAEENERKRIATDLHDNLGAFAASIISNLDLIKPVAESRSQTAIQELRNNSQAMVAQINDTIWALKKDALPLTSISDRIKSFIQRIQASYPDTPVNVVERIEQDITLSPAHAFHLFRIAQEALNNALRHSGALEIMVIIQSSKDHWQMIIADDGTGMPSQEAKGNGLQNMKERAREAGWLIRWKAGEASGTQVIISSAQEMGLSFF